MESQVSKEQIRIGTLAKASKGINYIKQIIPHGFESFSITFWKDLADVDIKEYSKMLLDVVKPLDIKISSVEIFGNPLEETPEDIETRRIWEMLIDNAHLFKTDIVAGFAGRIRNKPINESMPKFKEVFLPLAKRAKDKGVRLAFENCDMGGTWNFGDWNIAHSPAAWEMMFNEVNMDNVGLEWEPCHQMVKLIDPMPQLRKWVKKIFHVHGKDCTIYKDVIKEHGVFGPVQFAYHRTPGFGDSNWTDIISELRRGGFKGSIDIEGWHDPVYCKELEMTGQVHALNYLKQCRGNKFIPNPV